MFQDVQQQIKDLPDTIEYIDLKDGLNSFNYAKIQKDLSIKRGAESRLHYYAQSDLPGKIRPAFIKRM